MITREDVQKLIVEKHAAGLLVMDEDEAKLIFSSFGIPVVREKRVEGIDQAVAAAKEFGFPAALKGIGPGLLHKTESGMVRLGLGSEDQVRKAAREMQSSGKEILSAFLVQPMVTGKREFVAGMFNDSQFGPVIMFGLGGVLTEALNDIVLKIAPLADVDMDDMMDQLSSKKLLGAFRGEAAVDRDAIKKILGGLSDLALQNSNIQEIDINPLIIKKDGSPVAVDGLVVLGDTKKQENRTKKKPIDLSVLVSCFYPKSIAFIGASSVPGKWGHMLPTNTLSRDYKGSVYLVNPKGGKIIGRKVYKQLTDIEGDIDLAVVTIPAQKVIDLIPAFVQKNVRGMLLISSGFGEVGSEGKALEDILVEKAGKAGILVLGPNTMGVCNPHAQFFCSAAHAYPLPGSTALVCQSGNMGTQLLAFAEQQDIGIRAFSGSGNEAMVTIEDYMETFEIDELTRTVVLYIESIKDGARFFKSAARVSRKKPVVVLKGGRTQMGEKAAASHTGAMASDGRVFEAACRQAGVIQVEQPMELLDLSAVFSSLPLPKGKRVAIMTLGGGWGVITTDLCGDYGLEVPELSGDIVERLNKILPSFWSHGNPVDIVGEGDPDIPKTCMEELLKWDGCDAVIHLGIHGKRVLVNNMIDSVIKTDPNMDEKSASKFKKMLLKSEEEYVKYIVEMTHKYEKPVLGVSLLTDEISRTLYRYDNNPYKGVFFPSPERAVKALAGMWQYNKWRRTHS
ncbi:MAG: CoA-binding protein [Desulfobacteraceae bacterium]|nr:CoA-binding protein [Desulfobacteraceae bacterium]